MNLDAPNRLLDEAEDALESASGGRYQAEVSFIQRLLCGLGADVSLVGLSPAELLSAIRGNGPLARDARNVLEVLASPLQRPTEALRSGDWMLRAVPGTGDVGHVSVLASDDLLTPAALASEGIAAESARPGYYGLVIEAGAFPHSRSRPFARRMLDSRGRVPPNAAFLRPTYLQSIEDPGAKHLDELGVDELPQEEIHSTAFGRARNLTGDRTGIEIEAIRQLACPKETSDPKALFQLLSRDNWSAFRRLIAPCGACAAFSSGFGVAGMTWDQTSHELREKNPHVWLTVEAGQWRAAQTDINRRIAFGTDLMDDLYFDDDGFTLLSNAYTVRGRKRWDNWRHEDGPVMRRILIGTKKDTGVVGGIKRGEKEDVRLNGDAATRAARTRLSDYIQSGFVDNDWGRGGRRAVHSIRAMYDDLRGKGALTSFTSGGHTDVLDLKPKVFIRSLRLRYHLRETTLNRLQEILDNGATRLRTLSTNAEATRSTLSSTHQIDTDAFIKKVVDTLDFSLVASRADKELRGLDASMRVTTARVRDLRPRASGSAPRSHLDLEKQRVVAETLFKLYHELAADVDKGGLLTAISGVSADDSAMWKRQIEAAGSAALGLWFDRAREFYVPRSGRATGADFMIDTLDGSGMFTPDAWAAVAPVDQTNQNDPDVQKLFHASLVNEIQIELTRGVAYTERIERLTARRTPSAADVQNLKGAQFVLDKYVETMTILVEMKKDQVIDGVAAAVRAAEARNEAAPKCTTWAWQAVTQGKGETALSILKGP